MKNWPILSSHPSHLQTKIILVFLLFYRINKISFSLRRYNKRVCHSIFKCLTVGLKNSTVPRFFKSLLSDCKQMKHSSLCYITSIIPKKPKTPLSPKSKFTRTLKTQNSRTFNQTLLVLLT